MLARCPACDSKLKVPDEAAGKRIRCPICEAAMTLPQAPPAATPSQTRTRPISPEKNQSPVTPSQQVPRPNRPPQKLDNDLEILEVLRVKDPVGDRPKPKKKKRLVRKAEGPPTSHGADLLVWVFLIALVPLVLYIFIPQVPIEERIRKSIENNQELKEVMAEKGPLGVLRASPNLSLIGAHLPRNTKIHWLYALLTTIAFLVILGVMLVRSKVAPIHLFLTGFFTGTIGILLLLTFQFIAQLTLISGPMMMGGGVVMLIIRLIGFSYICALNPENGFLVSFFGFTCGVGFCEELCKAWPIKYYLSNAQKSDWRGTFLIGVGSGVGFGISEGISYAGAFYNGIEPGLTYLVRFSSCVALHGLWSGGVALLMYGNQDLLDAEPGWFSWLWNWLYYIAIAMVLHGLYDTLLKQHIYIGALAVALATFGWTFWLARYYWTYESPETA
ncbi:MAG: hypothetical protein U0903_06030 [Planctomycetales bacterium]